MLLSNFGEAPHDICEESVSHDSVGALVQDKSEGVRLSCGEGTRSSVGPIPQLLSSVQNASPGLIGDLGVGNVVQHEGNGSTRDTSEPRYIVNCSPR